MTNNKKHTIMIERIIVISLIIAAIHVSMKDGMIFEAFRRKLDALFDKPALRRVLWLKMPLYDCIVCMGGVWTLIIYPLLYGLNWRIIPVALGVIGANVVMAAIIKYLYYGND